MKWKRKKGSRQEEKTQVDAESGLLHVLGPEEEVLNEHLSSMGPSSKQ